MCLSVCCLLLSGDTLAQGFPLFTRLLAGLISQMTAGTPGTHELLYTLHTAHTLAQGF